MSTGDIFYNRQKSIPANLGTGTATSSNYLRGDMTWQTVAGTADISYFENLLIIENWNLTSYYKVFNDIMFNTFNDQTYIDNVNSTKNYDSVNTCYLTTLSTGGTTDIVSTQVDCSSWTNFNSVAVTQTTPGDVTASVIYHVISFDNKVTWKVFKSSAWTSVVRNNSGTWQYSNAGSWTNASSNTQVQALIQATDQTAYQWTKTNIEAMVSGDWMATDGWSTDVTTLDWTTRLINGTSVQPNGSQNAGTGYATITSTSGTTGSQVVTADETQYSIYYAWLAFDQSLASNSHWLSLDGPTTQAPNTLMVDLGSGNGKIINKYRMALADRGGESPVDWILQGTNNTNAAAGDSQNANGWTDLDTRSGRDGLATNTWSPYYTFTNSTAYRYWRIRVTKAANANYTDIGELHLVAASTQSVSPTFTKSIINRDIPIINTILISESWEASVNDPTSAYCLLDIEPTDSITLDTDLKAWVSINDGTNYEQITGLSIVGTNGTHNYVRGDISNITARTDKTIRLKVTSHNSKQLKLHSWSIGVKY